MGYNATTKHITDPVGVYDVKTCLANDSNDVATLCMANNVNMWSVGKPVYFAKVAQLTVNDLKTGRSISGYSVSYGIKKRASNVWGDYIETNASSQNFGVVKGAVWTYDKPVLDGTNVFRLTDFYNYWHLATPAITITLDQKERVSVPSSDTGTGDVLHYTLNFQYWLYTTGSMAPAQLFGACSTYYPSVILTCAVNSKIYQYVKSAKKEGSDKYWTIGEIGADSTQSGVQINIDTKDLRAAMKSDDSSHTIPECLVNGLQWTACFVLLSTSAVPGTTASHVYGSRTIVRLEYSAGLDRNTFTVISGKYAYISQMNYTVTLKKNGNNYYIDSISVTATKETNDQITFKVHADLRCIVGNVIVTNIGEGQSVSYDLNNRVTFAGQTGNVTPSGGVQIDRTTYYPTGDADPAHHRYCVCNLTFDDVNGTNNKGSWSGSCSIDVSGGSATITGTGTCS